MRNNRWKSILLCAWLTAMCLTGCGAAAADNDTDAASVTDEANDTADEAPQANESDKIADVAEIEDANETESESVFEGCALSILGDSISTYDGWIMEGAAIFYPFYGDLTDVSQTWWMRLLDDTGMELCANDSSSGSTCVGDSLDVGDFRYGCSSYRLSFLTGKQGKMPDVIIIYMGTNDLLKDIPIGDNDGTQLVEEGIVENFSDAYCLILDKLASEYPASEIYCCTLPPIGDGGDDMVYEDYVNKLGLISQDYSERIEAIADSKGISVIDLSDCGIGLSDLSEMTIDGVHFTTAGMEYIEQAMLTGLVGTSNE
ncbi:MAG: hypothetical protein J1F42_00650 [Lachnospiraceae bacterium]|nr:hypothetical protein [Lachnospiraceae bacterium]